MKFYLSLSFYFHSLPSEDEVNIEEFSSYPELYGHLEGKIQYALNHIDDMDFEYSQYIEVYSMDESGNTSMYPFSMEIDFDLPEPEVFCTVYHEHYGEQEKKIFSFTSLEEIHPFFFPSSSFEIST